MAAGWRIIRELDVRDGRGARKLQICVGDLVDVPTGWETDLLGVSAFLGDYDKTSGSVIGALGRAGVDVRALKGNQSISLSTGNCWISQSIAGSIRGVPYKRIVCTETPRGLTPRHAVGYFFTGLAGYLIRTPELKSISVPILGAGDQGDDKEGAFKNLVKEAALCLRGGLPLTLFRVVVLEDQEHDVLRWFDELVREDPHIADAYERTPEFDVFLSYSRRDGELIDKFYSTLTAAGRNVFMDKTSLNPGDVWPEKLDVAIARSKLFVAFVSAAFNQSVYCQQEALQAHRLSGSGVPLIFPVRIAKVDPASPLDRLHAATLQLETGLFAGSGSVAGICKAIEGALRT